ncbi:hypothetical protein [Flavobacterium salmonis]|nr:hypothetical protein [Flavobacterium salmonis]
MNLRTKKSIAKEVLYFFAGVVILLIFWAFLEIQNNYFQNKVINYKKEITELQSQIKEFETKPLLQPDKLKKLNENALEMSEAGYSQEDILTMKDDFLKLFASKNTLREQIKLKKLKINEKLKTDNVKKIYLKILNRNEIFHNIKLLAIILFVLLYPARIIFSSVKWAIKILKIKN